ncbi:MAG: hypothetical protein GEU98_11900 [Pseudonocardiaceae bacterium]|nr:hypothetical protein [Pseudonocardiaceae bacterium]
MSALLRDRLADKRMLIVLDNVADAGQVRPLPGDGGLVLVTSRSQLRGLVAREGARRIDRGGFDTTDAAALLVSSVGSDRVEAEPGHSSNSPSCAVGSRWRWRWQPSGASRFPDTSLAELVRELRNHRDRLDALTDPQDGSTDLRAAFSWSYRALRPDDARVFRSLSLHPGADLSLPAAAALIGASIGAARASLDRLVAVHLLGQQRPARYQFHDLLRVYAAERAREESGETEQASALCRLFDWYLHTAIAARRFVRPDPRLRPVLEAPESTVTGQDFPDHDEALGWFESERANLVAVIEYATEHGYLEHSWLVARPAVYTMVAVRTQERQAGSGCSRRRSVFPARRVVRAGKTAPIRMPSWR